MREAILVEIAQILAAYAVGDELMGAALEMWVPFTEDLRRGATAMLGGQDLMNLLLQQITQALGLGEGITIEDIRRERREIPALLDQAEQWARRRRS